MNQLYLYGFTTKHETEILFLEARLAYNLNKVQYTMKYAIILNKFTLVYLYEYAQNRSKASLHDMRSAGVATYLWSFTDAKNSTLFICSCIV